MATTTGMTMMTDTNVLERMPVSTPSDLTEIANRAPMQVQHGGHMSTATLMTASDTEAIRPDVPPRRRPSSRAGDVSAAVVGVLGGIALAISLPVALDGIGTPGGVANALGIVAAMAGTFLALVGCVLIARIPWVERGIGQDRLTAWHRKIGPYALFLIGGHVVLTTLGYAQAVNTSWFAQVIDLTFGSPWMLPAMAGFLLMIGLGVISWRRIRRRMRYETWLTAHQYFYLAVALAFGHQLESGSVFIGNRAAQSFWIGLYIVVAIAIIGWRVATPIARTLRHRIVVSGIERVDVETVNVHLTGRGLSRLNACGGQWLVFRFGTREWWWQGHPYSLSAGPTDTSMRITVKDLGDQSAALKHLAVGTRVGVEGPYGAFRADRRTTDDLVLIGAGVGITPVRALLDELPAHVRATVVYRVHSEPAPLANELRSVADTSGGRITVFIVAGSRQQYPLNPSQLLQVAPAIAKSDVYVCGPAGFIDAVRWSCRQLGVPARQFHDEQFDF